MNGTSGNECGLKQKPCWFEEPHGSHDRFSADLRTYIHCPGVEESRVAGDVDGAE